MSFRALTRKPTFADSMPALRILIAPSGFKESLGADEVAECIEIGISRAAGDHTFVQKLPLHDGGEGFSAALTKQHNGVIVEKMVTGPVGMPVQSHYGHFGADLKTAVIDMAAAAGLRLVPRDLRDPCRTTTYGVGELIATALDDGCNHIIIGCGDSGTSDGGAGMLQALGVRLLDEAGGELPKAGGGIDLAALRHISFDEIHPRLRPESRGNVTARSIKFLHPLTVTDPVRIEAVCNIKNVLCGPKGVARVFGPQKGASPEDVEVLSSGLENLARVAETVLHRDIAREPGSGASGGLGAGLLLLGACLRPRAEAINEHFGLQQVMNHKWDVVITAEGSIDWQSTRGKMTAEIARMAKAKGAQVIALAGTIGPGAEMCYDSGIKAYASILRAPVSLDEAIGSTSELLTDSAERAMRMIMIGMLLSKSL